MTKAQDLLQLAQEMLSADVMLPNLVAVITEDMVQPTQQTKRPQSGANAVQNSAEITIKITALETLRNLIEASHNLTDDHHFDSLIQCAVAVLYLHQGNKMIQMSTLSILAALRDKNMDLTVKSILSGSLSQVQLNIVKQLANAYDRTLAKQL